MKIGTVREKCLDCCGGSSREVKACPSHECPLWEYRFGKEPETIRRREPKLLDPIYVVLAGAVLDDLGSAWARWALDNPREALGSTEDDRQGVQGVDLVVGQKSELGQDVVVQQMGLVD